MINTSDLLEDYQDTRMYVSKPKNLRTFTTSDIAEIFQFREESIRKLKDKLGIKGTIIKTKNSRRMVFSYEEYLIFKNYFKHQPKMSKAVMKVNRKPKVENDPAIELLIKEHPLVKDIRFFKESYFPDIIPDCLKNIDEEEEMECQAV